MNEHFRKLAVEAKIIPPDYVNIDGDDFPPGLNKFAELIVKECIDQISVNHDPNSDWDWEVSRGHAIAIIKEHFGVE